MTTASIRQFNPPLGWQPQADWVSIINPGANEINLLVSDQLLATIAFAVTVASSGTYSIDWGDGTVEDSRASTTIYQHTYTRGSGTPCSMGYTTFKVRIYNASGNITAFAVKDHNLTSNIKFYPLLNADLSGVTTFTTLTNAFYGPNCAQLQHIKLASSLPSCTSLNAFAQNCYSLVSVEMPAAMNAVTNAQNAFNNCSALRVISWPSSMSSCTNFSGIHYQCYSLSICNLPTTVGNTTQWSQALYACYSLYSITLPTGQASLTGLSGMFTSCYSLSVATNIGSFGSTSQAVDGSNFLNNCEMLGAGTTLSFAQFWLKFLFNGSSGKLNKVTGIRLTNASSTFGGTAPQIDISYCSLPDTALNTLFGDLPTVTNKTIRITGCTGVATCTTGIATAKGWTVNSST